MTPFIDALEAELTQAATRHHEQLGARRDRGGSARRRRVALVVACAVLVLLVTTTGIGLPGGGTRGVVAVADALPILQRPTTDASRFRDELRELASAGMRFNAAHPIKARGGTAYVMTSKDGSLTCLALPDPPAGFGQACGSTTSVERRGLTGELTSPVAAAPPTELMIILPLGAGAPVVKYMDGTSTAMPTTDGVALGVFPQDATVSFETAEGTRSLTVRAHEPQGTMSFQCADGRVIDAPSKRLPSDSDRRALCATSAPTRGG